MLIKKKWTYSFIYLSIHEFINSFIYIQYVVYVQMNVLSAAYTEILFNFN